MFEFVNAIKTANMMCNEKWKTGKCDCPFVVDVGDDGGTYGCSISMLAFKEPEKFENILANYINEKAKTLDEQQNK